MHAAEQQHGADTAVVDYDVQQTQAVFGFR